MGPLAVEEFPKEGEPGGPLVVEEFPVLITLTYRDPRGTTQAAPLPEGSCHVVTEGRESFA